MYLQACLCVWSGRIFAKSLFIEVGQAFTWRFGGELQQGGLWTRGLRVREQKVNGRLIYERPPDRTEFSHPFRQILSSSNRPRLAPHSFHPLAKSCSRPYADCYYAPTGYLVVEQERGINESPWRGAPREKSYCNEEFRLILCSILTASYRCASASRDFRDIVELGLLGSTKLRYF